MGAILGKFKNIIMVYEAVIVGSCGGEESEEAEGESLRCKLGEGLVGLGRRQLMVGREDEARAHPSYSHINSKSLVVWKDLRYVQSSSSLRNIYIDR